MDDLSNRETLTARVVTPFPPEVILGRIRRREAQNHAFVERVRARFGDGPVVVDDQADVVALGVPCDDCLALVYVDGEDGHLVQFGSAGGQRWAALISARCGRLGGAR